MLRTRSRKFAALAQRHSLAALGPVTISGAHFLASFILLRCLPNAEFGLFAFVIIVTGLCLSLTDGLLNAPMASLALSSSASRGTELRTYMKASPVLALLLGAGVFATMLFSGAHPDAAAAFGVYACAMSLRLFARTYAYTTSDVKRVVMSDCAYSGSLLVGLAGSLILGRVRFFDTALIMAAGAAIALLPFSRLFSSLLLDAIRSGSVRAYQTTWTSIGRWTLLGVVTSEITINANAYLVTFICGAKSFALIAVGSLLMRPFSLIATALPDQERPALSRRIATGDKEGVARVGRDYAYVMAVIWAGTMALAGTVLMWCPRLVVKDGYHRNDVIVVVLLWAAIMAVRGARAFDVLLLQAAREYRPLADASVKSSGIALISTLVLLLIFGPVTSLLGILAGDFVLWMFVIAGVRRWKLKFC